MTRTKTDYARCPNCKEYGWLNSHRCPPEWWCWQPDHEIDYKGNRHEDVEDFASRIHASDARVAAEKYCHQADSGSGDYDIISNGGAVVRVQSVNGGAITEYDINAYSEPVYEAQLRKHEA